MFTNLKKTGNNNTPAMFFVMWPLFLGLIDQSKNAKTLVKKHEILATPYYRDRIWKCIPSAKQQASSFTFLHIHYCGFMFSPDYQCMPFCRQKVSIDKRRHGSLFSFTTPYTK